MFRFSTLYGTVKSSKPVTVFEWLVLMNTGTFWQQFWRTHWTLKVAPPDDQIYILGLPFGMRGHTVEEWLAFFCLTARRFRCEALVVTPDTAASSHSQKKPAKIDVRLMGRSWSTTVGQDVFYKLWHFCCFYLNDMQTQTESKLKVNPVHPIDWMEAKDMCDPTSLKTTSVVRSQLTGVKPAALD